MFNRRIEIISADITTLKVTAVVNAANSSLMGGGGVDGAIHRAGGPAILEECRNLRSTTLPDGLPPGEAVLTGGGALKADYVIHTVGPVWHGGSNNEEAILVNAYRNSLKIALEHKMGSVAFPAISTGVYSFPLDKAAVTAWKTVTGFLAENSFPEKVILCFYSEKARRLFIESAGIKQY